MKVDIWRYFRRQLVTWVIMVTAILTGLWSNVSYERAYANPNAYNSSDDWVVYWYLCGSDLETQYGSATADIEELLNVNLPSNVKVVIQTGGSTEWQNNLIGNNVVGRYLYDANGLHELELAPDADMGSRSTLQEFLQFGKDNFPADHRVFVFWNHGGGTTGGVCVDERTDNNLSLNDIQNAFAGVYGTSQGTPPFELVGFDACLMSTLDVANSLHGISRYMTASEELEPSNGWGTLDGAIRVLESLRTYIYERAEDIPIDCLWVAW